MPYLEAGTRESVQCQQWIRQPGLSLPYFRYPPCTVDDEGNILEFLKFNPGWIAISGRDLEQRIKERWKVSIGHDDPEKVAQRAKDKGYIEDFHSDKIGSRLYVKPLW
jgi:hypothetical protein